MGTYVHTTAAASHSIAPTHGDSHSQLQLINSPTLDSKMSGLKLAMCALVIFAVYVSTAKAQWFGSFNHAQDRARFTSCYGKACGDSCIMGDIAGTCEFSGQCVVGEFDLKNCIEGSGYDYYEDK